MIYVIPAVCAGGGLVAAHLATLFGYRRLALLWCALLAILTAWLIWTGRQASGADGIAYGVAALLMALPALAGSGLGVLTGLYRRGKDGQENGHDSRDDPA